MISGRINIASLNRNHRIIINNTEEIKADLKQLKQAQSLKIGGDAKNSNINVGNNNSINNITIYLNPLSEILNMINDDMKGYKHTGDINFVKRSFKKWQEATGFLDLISEDKLKKTPLTENIDKMISKISPEYYKDIARYLNKNHFDIKNKEIEYVSFQIKILYRISISIIIEIGKMLLAER